MLSLRAKNITKGAVVVIGASLLCIGVLVPWLSIFFEDTFLLALKESMPNWHSHFWVSFFIPDMVIYGVSGFLMAMVIGFMSRKTITTIFALLMATIFTVIMLFRTIQLLPHDLRNSAQVFLGFSWLLRVVSLWVCAFLGVWFIAWISRKKMMLMHRDDSVVSQH